MRKGPAQDDPDLRDFHFFHHSTSNAKDKNRLGREIYAAFNAFRLHDPNRRVLIAPIDLRLVEIYEQNVIGKMDVRERKTVDQLHRIAQWLSKNGEGLTVQDLCSPLKPITAYSAYIDRMATKSGAGTRKQIVESLQKVRAFVIKSHIDTASLPGAP
jgi:hypothetical protein